MKPVHLAKGVIPLYFHSKSTSGPIWNVTMTANIAPMTRVIVQNGDTLNKVMMNDGFEWFCLTNKKRNEPIAAMTITIIAAIGIAGSSAVG